MDDKGNKAPTLDGGFIFFATNEQNDIGMVTSAISLLIAVVVVCTAILWHKIDSLKK